MKLEDWLAWPTRSSDPGVNFVVLVGLLFLGILALSVGAIFLIPVLLVIGIAKGVHMYMSRPVATDRLAIETQQRAVNANFPTTQQFLDGHIDRLLDSFGDNPPAYNIFLAMGRATETLYDTEDLLNPIPPIPPTDTIEEGRYRDRLLAHMKKTNDAPKTIGAISNTLGAAYAGFLESLPPMARTTSAIFGQTDERRAFATLPVIDIVQNVGKSVLNLTLPFFSEEAHELGVFHELRGQLERNTHKASGADYPARAQKLIFPDAHKGTPVEIVSTYLASTPLENLFYAPVPFDFIDQIREHALVIASTGWGKTELIKGLTLELLKRPDPPSIIILTSQGSMLEAIRHLQVLAPGQRLSERLAIVDPEADPPPALNIFSLPTERTGHYARNIREQVEAGTTQTFQYLFSALAQELTGKQTTALVFVVSLILSIPGATLDMFRELFEERASSIDDSRFAEHIRKLHPTVQSFFETQFFKSAFSDTRSQVARRIYRLQSVPAFARMFGATANKLDMFDLMNRGGICLVNTSKLLLGDDASSLFGRYIISLVMRAAFERVAIPESKRRPCLLFVDEASEYVDQSFEALLSKVRQFNVGVLMAFQHVTQMASVQNSLLANTTVKLCGQLNMHDARVMAGELRCDPIFITDLQKTKRSTQWACHVRNMTTHAVRIETQFGLLEKEPQMTKEVHDKLLIDNTARYSAPPPAPEPPEPPSPPAAEELPTVAMAESIAPAELPKPKRRRKAKSATEATPDW